MGIFPDEINGTHTHVPTLLPLLIFPNVPTAWRYALRVLPKALRKDSKFWYEREPGRQRKQVVESRKAIGSFQSNQVGWN